MPARQRKTSPPRRQPANRPDARRIQRTLRDVFGLEELRPGQGDVIRSALAGRNTLAIMPTGAGKSLCYQLPALLLPGITVVISPLIALMKDQVDKLTRLGVAAAQVNSAITASEEDQALDAIDREHAEFVLTTPERMNEPEFLDTLRGKTIDLVVIDEAHCISEWGHDFRPAYLELGRIVKALGSPPVLALTATATRDVVEDIGKQLNLPDLNVLNTGIYRPNLEYEVRTVDSEDAKDLQLIRLLHSIEGLGIVYTATVKHAESVTTTLQAAGFEAARYHGRMNARDRHDVQERFMRGELKAIVATNAFGMGIDNSDIRFVIHYDMPGSVDAYYQESGRAGRDGAHARCILLYHPPDRRTHMFFMAGKYPRFTHIDAVYNALVALNAHTAPVSIEHLAAQATGVAASKLRTVLALMEELGVVSLRVDRSVRLRRQQLGETDLAELAKRYEVRQEQDRAKLDRMITYAQSALCRWRMLLDAFGETAAEDCGHCDNCRRAVHRDAPVPETTTVPPAETVATADAVLLPALKIGDPVSVPVHGWGEVRSIEDERVEVAFPDGTLRKFNPDFLIPQAS